MIDEDKLNSTEEVALEILREIFPSSSIGTGKEESHQGQADFLVKTKGKLLVVEVKATQYPRISEIEGKLAVALLQIRKWTGNDYERAIVMIEVPSLGPKVLAYIRDFMGMHAPKAGWCLFDPSGAYNFEMESRGIVQSAAPIRKPKNAPSAPKGSLFSDLNRWMLKLLLLSDLPSNLWGGDCPRPRTASELRKFAKVSTEKAYSFLRSFTAAGFIQNDEDGIRIIRRRELIRTWMRHQLTFQHDYTPARWLFGPIDSLSDVPMPVDGSVSFAITGYEACRMLGVLHTPVHRREVYIHGNITEALSSWNLAPCDVRDADLFLIKMPYPQSILRAAVNIHQLPVVDALEAALSVYGQVPRGLEQADYIITQVLGWESISEQ